MGCRVGLRAGAEGALVVETPVALTHNTSSQITLILLGGPQGLLWCELSGSSLEWKELEARLDLKWGPQCGPDPDVEGKTMRGRGLI